MKRILVAFWLTIAWVLLLAAPALASSVTTVAGDRNADVFVAAAASESLTSQRVSALVVTVDSQEALAVRKAVQDAAKAGSMILAFGAEEEQLLSLIPGAGGGSARAQIL